MGNTVQSRYSELFGQQYFVGFAISRWIFVSRETGNPGNPRNFPGNFPGNLVKLKKQ